MEWHWWHKHHDEHEEHEEKEIELLEEAVKLEREEVGILRRTFRPRLAVIKLGFTEKTMGTPGTPAPVVGPVTINIGDVIVASVVGFDQFGQPWTGAMPTATFTDDDSVATSLDPSTNQVTGLAGGVGNITGSLTSAEGLALTDTESVTVLPAPPPPEPVLSSIKVAFSPAAPAAAASVRK